jgi:hypothetical protein
MTGNLFINIRNGDFMDMTRREEEVPVGISIQRGLFLRNSFCGGASTNEEGVAFTLMVPYWEIAIIATIEYLTYGVADPRLLAEVEIYRDETRMSLDDAAVLSEKGALRRLGVNIVTFCVFTKTDLGVELASEIADVLAIQDNAISKWLHEKIAMNSRETSEYEHMDPPTIH